MDIMMLGETLTCDLQASSSQEFFGFWMPAGGNEGVGAVETFFVSASNEWTVSMQTKSSDAVDPASATGIIGSVNVTSTTPQVFKFDLLNAKDLVRYIVSCGADTLSHIHFQLAQPLWAPN